MLRILKNFNIHLLTFNPYPNTTTLKLNIKYINLPTLFSKSNIISLHYPLTPKNYHLLNKTTFNQIKNNIIIINTNHNTLINSQTTIKTLKNQKINSLNINIYKNKHNLFFKNKSNNIIQNNIFHHLSTYHNILFTKHQTFLTTKTLTNISQTTLQNLNNLKKNKTYPNKLI